MTSAPYSYDRRVAAKTLDLSHYDLEGLLDGRPVTVYHGTTKLFAAFDMSKSRPELVDAYYGVGIFLTPSKRVAVQYADANRNIGFDPDIIDDLRSINPGAGAFMQSLFKLGNAAWEAWSPEGLGVAPEDFSDAMEKAVGGADPNMVADICRYVIGSKLTLAVDDGPSFALFNKSTGMPDWVYANLDELGLDSFKYRPKVYTVTVTASNPLVTASKSQAKTARAKGYDSVVYYGPGLVGGVPEVAVFHSSAVRIVHVEEA